MRTDRLRAEYQIEFRYTLFPLHPDTPDEGLSLQELFAGRSFDIDAMQARLATLMAKEGLPFSQRPMTYNSRLAQELAKWAETQAGVRTHRADAVESGELVDVGNGKQAGNERWPVPSSRPGSRARPPATVDARAVPRPDAGTDPVRGSGAGAARRVAHDSSFLETDHYALPITRQTNQPS